jgi:hypothetical protein
MKAYRSPFLRSMCYFLTLSLVCLPTTSIAATTGYRNTTEELDLSRVRLVVVASTELKEALHNRTVALFKSAGLSLPDSGSSKAPRLATLTLTLNPQPLTDICPGKVLYAPSLALTEPVTIQRTSAVIQDSTWLFGSSLQVREPITDEQIEADLDGLINQFIEDYKAANPQDRSQDKPATPDLGNSQRLSQRALGDHCPGKVLYERGLYLVEEVRITRRPRVLLWIDTWLQESVRIVPPLSRQGLESDLRLLLQEFIRTHHTQ